MEVEVEMEMEFEVELPFRTSDDEALNEDRTRATSNSISDEVLIPRVNGIGLLS